MSHRGGPDGIGASRLTCFRAVLDANCFRGAQLSELEAIKQSGFRLSLSIEALRETWAHSLRKDDMGLLVGPLARTAPLLDTEAPIAFCGRALLCKIGAIDRADAEKSERFRDSINGGWMALVAARLQEDHWRTVGKELDDELTGEKRYWMNMVEQIKVVMRDLRTTEKALERKIYSDERAIERLRIALRPRVLLSPSADERCDAWARYMARKLILARQAQPQENDWVDSRHLQHVAWPAFLVTTDFGLIRAVDASRSPQAAWVRTPVELARDPVERSAPWGKPRQEISRRFVRAPDFQKRQEEWRKACQTGSSKSG